ncbi:Pentatricopeptide repeat-containing protein, mitochondrial [Vitis vinifera]|uniref:Pentatricopeptide repeat-containing protein, mitochondrial n=1 Tax=Vitis vinifera TaxID=29760 RepID=A0A438EH84_VITVI|nr:Pentatricopeptide repeat-containing protein, mitochondrial [Vitis vinifera]
MSAALTVSSKQSKLLRFLRPQTPPNLSSLLRHLSAEPDHHPPAPPPQNVSPSVVNLVVELLQTTDNDWNEDKLHQLLFPTTSPPPPPHNLLQITRLLGSTAKALKFFNWVQANSPCQDSPLLSFTLEAVFEHASREPNSHNKLLDLFKTSKSHKIPLSVNAATLLIRCFGRAQMVDESLLVYNELCPSRRLTHIRNILIDVLFRKGRVDDALHLLDEMLQPKAEFPPNSNTGHIVFSALSKRDKVGRAVDEEEIVGLVSKFAEHEVFPNSIWLTQLISRLCRSGRTDRAWDVLHGLMKLGGVMEAASCNALLTALGRAREFKRMNTLLAEMKEMDIQPNVVTFGILINHLCKFRRVDEALEVLRR